MMLPAPAVVPPTVLLLAPNAIPTLSSAVPFPSGLPRAVIRRGAGDIGAEVIPLNDVACGSGTLDIDALTLPEMMLRAPATIPPTTLSLALPSINTA